MYFLTPISRLPQDLVASETDRRLRAIEPLPIGCHNFSQATYNELVWREMRLELTPKDVVDLQDMMDDEMLTVKEGLLKC